MVIAWMKKVKVVVLLVVPHRLVPVHCLSEHGTN